MFFINVLDQGPKMDLKNDDLNNETKKSVQSPRESKESNDTLPTDKSEKENSQTDVKSNEKDQAADNVASNQEVKQAEPSNVDNVYNGSIQEEEEPAAKKRRISASAFLQISDHPVHTNVIPQSISEDIKSYLSSTSNMVRWVVNYISTYYFMQQKSFYITLEPSKFIDSLILPFRYQQLIPNSL